MTIDILSDLHIDFYFRHSLTDEAVKSIYSHIVTDNQKREIGDVLIVAGDIGHYNAQNVTVLGIIKKIFGYKHIICVLGNHDYYLPDNGSRKDYFDKSLFRAERLRALINKEKGMHCLDGNVVEIDGVRFGGCDSWYDGEYTKQNFKESSVRKVPIDDTYMNQLWKQSMHDATAIYNFNWQEYAQLEKEKIEKIYKDVDVMITHINPSINKEHTSHSFRDAESTGFFTFDGSNYLREGSMKYWIYGHTHVEMEYELYGVKCICNPMGYPSENGNGEWAWIKSIEI